MASDSEPNLTDSERAQLSARADQFYHALTRGPVSDWDHFLDGLPVRVRLAVLTELVLIDLGHRWGRGERPVIEDYIARFPELGPRGAVPAKLILEEHRCRVRAGEPHSPRQYQDRFPVQFPTIRDQLEDSARSVGVDLGSVRTGPPGGSGPIGWASSGKMSVSRQYEMIERLGSGNFGEVWKARKNPSGIEKAIKVVSQPADREAAQRELRALELIKNFRHPYLLATEDFWVENNRLHIVMELADYTLRGRLKQCAEDGLPGIPEDELLAYFMEAAEGLDYLHEKHVVHRDVKPDNILVLNGHAKVADFGLARHQEKEMASMSFAGTPAYMAPEVWGREGGPPSDLYSLAFAYVELRQGRSPLKPVPMLEMMLAHLDGQFEFADFMPEAERQVLRKAMSRSPQERHPSCIAFVEELAHVMGRSFIRKASRTGGSGPRPALKADDDPNPNRTPVKPKPGLGSGTTTGTVRNDPRTYREADYTETRTGSHTLHEPPRPPKPGAKSRGGLLLAGGVTAALVAVIGFLVWLMFFSTPTPPVTTEPTPPKKGNGNDDKDNNKNGGKDNKNDEDKKKDPVPSIILPRGTVRAPDAAEVQLFDGRKVYDRVVFPVPGVTDEVRFRLVPAGGPTKTAPFYLLESKVWNQLYADAAVKAGITPRERAQPSDPDAPAVDLTAEEASVFADRVFGGKLPTPDQWDHAAGYYDRGNLAGPTQRGGTPRVGLPAPEPTHGPGHGSDINSLGLIDMAGNGREWTRAVLPGKDQPPQIVDNGRFDATALMILRGRNYTLTRPLTFAILDYEQKTPQTQFARTPSRYTGFRVALPLP